MIEIERYIPECWLWIPRLLGVLNVSPVLIRHDIPDDIIIEILSRLSADCVIKCRMVCKRWHTLTSTTCFAELHLKRGATYAPPSMFVQQLLESRVVQDELDCCICDFDEVKNGFWKRRIYTKVNNRWFYDKIADIMPFVSCSVDGLLVFRSSLEQEEQVVILNPLTKELVRVYAPFSISRLCGIYRDPLTHEYKLLLIHSGSNYFTASLKTMVIKKLKYTSRWINEIYYARMVPAEGSLHWFVTDDPRIRYMFNLKIMVFNTKTEEFRVVAHPGNESFNRVNGFAGVELSETGGKLWLFLTSCEDIQAWVLEDHANWAWNKKYTASLHWSTWRFPYHRSYNELSFYPNEVTIMGINNSAELLICWNKRGMFWYNLENKTISKASLFEKDNCYEHKGRPIESCSYIKTLVRLTPLTTQILHEKQTAPSARCDLKFVSFPG